MTNVTKSRTKDAVDDGTALVDTMLTIVKEVGEMLASVPYVKSVSGIVLQLIKIRDEVKINKERCQEIIDKILSISKIIYERLLELGKSNAKNKLGRLENHLVDYGRTLGGIYRTMEKHASRSTFRKIIQRGLDDLNRYDRVLDSFNSKIILDILIEIRVEQSVSVKKTEIASISDLSAHHVLPAKPHLIIERDQELKVVVDMLLLEESSRIAILGGGGIGKTTTALAALHNPYVAMRYASRYFLSCESILSVEGLLTSILNILGIQSAHRNADNLGTICHSLQRPTRSILCLDNFETPWEPSETRAKVEDILSTLASISNLSLIITLRGTQRPAKISWTKPLLPPLDTLSPSGAEVIVQEIVGFMDADIHLLLDSVDGVPLAVTLISYLIRDGEPPHSLWKRWPTERTKMIERGGDDPQSNLDASISLSIYSPRMRKDPEAIQVLAALSLLPDGFPASDGSLDALQTHIAAKNIHRNLQTLRSVALVATSERGGHPRLRMLSPVRLFCQQSLTNEVSQSLNGMTSYYIQLIQTAKYRYYIASMYASVQPEVKNVHAVFQKAFNEGYPDTESLINGTIYLTSWSRYVGYMYDDTIRLAHTHSKNSPKLRAECLRAMGLLYHVWNRLDDAEGSFTQAFELYKTDNNTYGQGTALKSLGDIHILRDQLDDAERTLNKAQSLFEQAQSRKGEANCLRSLAELYSRRDQILDAETALNKALDYYELSKNTSGQLYVQDRLGALNLRRDHWRRVGGPERWRRDD
ncbi:hypothetical protein HYPSUDRAFT_218940 [Hypholoma sublateritium FD-334 SS-4]|uniref:NB-ARC domain-containing protein n=1 Tax=Hypholoma sublateritium (strain FD-334 SS-4) TaxID=945553 RepID=A0A0D2PAG8_HYPSF|nr:hypothetical protein HYPSUDRAFT_218940 [Hypholoma sublateritium FD-334 SS-4]